MNKTFSGIAASLVAFTTLSQSAYAHHDDMLVTRELQDSGNYCYIDLPPELNRSEVENQYGDMYSAPREIARPQRAFYFSSQGILDIQRDNNSVSITLDRSGLIGQQFSVHRHMRPDDIVTIPQGIAKPEAKVTMDLTARTILMDLSAGLSEVIALNEARFEKIDRQIIEEELYIGVFEEFGVAAFNSPRDEYFGVDIQPADTTDEADYLSQAKFHLSIIDVEGEGASAYFYQRLDTSGPQAFTDQGWSDPPMEISARLICTSTIDLVN